MSGHRPRKRFGQHFLHERGVIERIVECFAPKPGQLVVEIGPGQGALTGPLLDRLGRLHVIELDRDLAAELPGLCAGHGELEIHQADALRFDFAGLGNGRPLRVIGNLPYNISTPLLFHLIGYGPAIGDMMFMVQKEVAERLAAAPGGKDYGRLSVMVQWRCEVERLFDVGPGAFRPPPRVDSTVVRLVPRTPDRIAACDPEALGRLVQAAFAQRRKTLRNSLRGFASAEQLRDAGIDPDRRAETLSPEDFVRVTRIVTQTESPL